jgi:hypothetical protein
MDKVSDTFVANDIPATPRVASPIRRKTGYFSRAISNSSALSPTAADASRRDRERKLLALKPSRGELEVCELQVRNIRTNDMARKVYVVLKLCVEIPSTDVIGETQMHVERLEKTTLTVDANKADYPYTYPKFVWPGEKFRFEGVSTTHHHLLFEVWQSRLIAKDVMVGCILVPLTYFKFARVNGSMKHMTAYKWVALRPAELLDGELHVQVNWREDFQLKPSPRSSLALTAGSPRTPRTPRSTSGRSSIVGSGTLVAVGGGGAAADAAGAAATRKPGRRLSSRFAQSHVDMTSNSDDGFYDRCGHTYGVAGAVLFHTPLRLRQECAALTSSSEVQKTE